MVMEEHIPGRLNGNGNKSIAVPVDLPSAQPVTMQASAARVRPRQHSQIASARGAGDRIRFRGGAARAAACRAAASPSRTGPGDPPPALADLRAPERLAIDYADAAELASSCAMALKALTANQPTFWKALRAQGIFRGHGAAPKVAFFTWDKVRST